MNRYFILIAASAISALNGLAQAPAKHVVQDAPPFSSWEIEVKPKKLDSSPASRATDAPLNGQPPSVRLLEKIEIEKMGERRREISVWSDGQSSQQWYFDGAILIENPRSQKVLVMKADRLNELQKRVFAQHQSGGDFPDLQWVSPETFKTVEVRDGKECRRYELSLPSTKDPTGKESGGMRKAAWIDFRSGLPVATESMADTRTYTFKESNPVELPANFRKALETFQKADAAP